MNRHLLVKNYTAVDGERLAYLFFLGVLVGHQSVCVQWQREHEEGGADRREQDLAGRTTGSHITRTNTKVGQACHVRQPTSISSLVVVWDMTADRH